MVAELSMLPQLPQLLLQLPPRLLLPPGSPQHHLRSLATRAHEGSVADGNAEGAAAEQEVGATAAERDEAVELFLLGTGAAIPSKYRNVSAILLQLRPPATQGATVGCQLGCLLDAGEGTMGALCRRFGGQVDEMIASLQLVWISHIHADHHLGLLQVLQRHTALRLPQPLLVIGPRSLQVL